MEEKEREEVEERVEVEESRGWRRGRWRSRRWRSRRWRRALTWRDWSIGAYHGLLHLTHGVDGLQAPETG